MTYLILLMLLEPPGYCIVALFERHLDPHGFPVLGYDSRFSWLGVGGVCGEAKNNIIPCWTMLTSRHFFAFRQTPITLAYHYIACL